MSEIEKYYAAQQNTAGRAIVGGLDCVDRNPTVEENIDIKIRAHEAEIEKLKKSKETLGPLLAMRIRDIRDAMNY